MSEINNIKTSVPLGVEATRIANGQGKRDDVKTADGQNITKNTDKVTLTDSATQLQSLQQIIADSPEVNAPKVEALRAEIAAGTYTIDATELAQNIIDFEQQTIA